MATYFADATVPQTVDVSPTCFAASDAESSGRGAYARAAAEFGALRGRLCISADAATPRFVRTADWQ